MNIKTITIIGANGAMGSNISGIFASFGNAKVYMVSRTLDKSQVAVDKAAKSVKAGAIKEKLIPVDYSKLGKCVRESDWVVESVAENIHIKIEVNNEIAKYVGDNTIITTNTSGLSINELAQVFPERIRKNYMGTHFYNPPYNLTLCELIPSKHTDKQLYGQVRKYMSSKLYRTVVEVKDSPAFMGNRIGFQFINEALIYAEKYKERGGIDYIDSILGQFSGRSMPPLITSDFVGLDVHKAIVDNVYTNTSDYAKNTFIMPNFAIDLISRGRVGKKTKAGLYKQELSDKGAKRNLVYDINSGIYRDKLDFNFVVIENMIAAFRVGDYKRAFDTLISSQSVEAELCLEFLLKYVIYSLTTACEVGYNIQSVDDVMATGFNWCPPLAVVQALFGVENVKHLVRERLSKELNSQVDLEKIFYNVGVSQYDYRRFFKAKK